MKIAIIGTQSTGKTTLLNHLDTHLQSIGHTTLALPEFARLCPFPINENTTLDAQQWIQEAQMREEARIDHENNILLCDRGTLDNFAYFYRAAKLMDFVDSIKDWELRAAEHMRTYDIVFKTTCLYIPAVLDGKRSTSEEFRKEIDILIHELLRKHSIPYISLPQTENYDVHVKHIMKHAGHLLPERSRLTPLLEAVGV